MKQSTSMAFTKEYITTTRYVLPLCVGIIIFGNHYIRDSVGALEKQIESDLGLSPQQYALLNSVFFAPNIVSPFIAGMIEKRLGGGVNTMLISITIANIGHFVFCLGAQESKIATMFIGRFLAGSMYEVIDTMAVVITGPHYQSSWGALCGIINGFIRLGSVFNFLLSPIALKYCGVACALWLAFFVAFLGSPCAIYMKKVDTILRSSNISKAMSAGNYDNCPLVETVEMQETISLIDICSSQSNSNDGGSGGRRGLAVDDEISSDRSQLDTAHSDPENNCNSIDNSSSSSNSITNKSIGSWYSKIFPFKELSTRYYFYVLSGMFLYGSMVPFWFMGGKYLQDYYHMNVTAADSLMLLPEGAIVVVSLPLGLLLDKYNPKLSFKLTLLGVSCLLLPFSYLLLCIGCDGQIVKISPLISMGLLGLGYALSNSIFWATITFAIGNQEHLGIASGLICSCMNVLPTLIPPLTTRFIRVDDGKSYLMVLAATGVIASITAFLSAYYTVEESSNSNSNSSNSNSSVSKSTSTDSSKLDSKSNNSSTKKSGSSVSNIVLDGKKSYKSTSSSGLGFVDDGNHQDEDDNDNDSDEDGIELTRKEASIMLKLTSMIEGNNTGGDGKSGRSSSSKIRSELSYVKVNSSDEFE